MAWAHEAARSGSVSSEREARPRDVDGISIVFMARLQATRSGTIREWICLRQLVIRIGSKCLPANSTSPSASSTSTCTIHVNFGYNAAKFTFLLGLGAIVMASAVANIHAASNSRFNAEALAWDSRPFVHEASLAASQAITSRLQTLNLPKDGAQVLEIGCGTGILSLLLSTHPNVARIVAVDAAEGMIDVLKTKLKDKNILNSKILPLALMLEDPEDSSLPSDCRGSGGKQKFDLVTSHLVLHHIPDLRSVLQTMFECLAPGGCIMLTDFEDFGPEAKRFHPASKMDGVARHGINAIDMTKLLQVIGFQDVLVEAAWTMDKTVEKFEGEYGDTGKAEGGMGENMKFPFVLCYGIKR